MPFRALQTKIRNDPLGPGGLGQLAGNLAWVRDVAFTEHIASTGEHNAWQVPRRVINVNSAGSSSSPSTTDVVGVSKPSTGRYVLTLANGRFSANARVQLNVNSKVDIQSKPCISGWKMISANSIEVYIKKLSTALGVAGNVWADLDAGFNLAIHSEPLPRGTYTADAAGHARGDTLTDVRTDWDATAQAHGDMYTMLTAAHTTAGAHNVFEVARHWAHVNYQPTGTTYEAPEASSSSITLNRLGTGQVEVNWPASMSAPIATFLCPDYQRMYAGGSPDDIFIMNAEAGTSKATVYIYKCEAPAYDTWSAADADFFIVCHGN